MASNLIRLKQINQSELSGFIIDAVESTELYNQIASGTAYFNSGIYYFRVLPKTVESNKSFSIGQGNLISGDTSNNIFGGSYNLIGTDLTNSVIIGGQNNTLEGSGNTNSIIMSDLSYIDVNGFNNGVLFGNGNYITGQSGDGNVIIGGLYNLIQPSTDSNNLILNGQNNVLLGTQSIIIGGYFNYSSGSNQVIMTDFGSALGDYAALIGGRENVIQGGKHNAIINGYNNYILRPFTYTGDFTGSNSIIGSWKSNILPDSRFALILGGAYQNVSGFATILIGGYENRLSGNYSALVGGFSNIVSGAASTIQGGAYNSVYGNYSTIIGGRDNLVSGAGDSFSIGRNNQLFASGAGFISDGSNRVKIVTGSAFNNTLNIDFLNGVNVKSKLKVDGSGTFSNLKVDGNLIVDSGTGIFSAVDLNNINDLNLSGVNVSITNGNVTLTNPLSAPNLVYNTGNQTISGSNFTLTNSNINFSGNNINFENQNNINLAYQFPAYTGIRRYSPLDFYNATATNGAVVSGAVNYFPFLIKKKVTDPKACIDMVLYATNNAKVVIGIYSGNYGFENAKLITSGFINVNSLNTGIYRTTLNGTFNQGPYILASMLETGVGSTFRVIGSNGFREHFGINTGSNILHGVNSTALTNVIADTGVSALPLNISSAATWYANTATNCSPLVFLEY